MSAWPTVPFEDVLKDRTSSVARIPQREYLSEGDLAIVDQGRDLIGGYTSATHNAYRGPFPVLLFGDHTRVLKYIDFPFAAGGQGARILEVSSQYNPRFIYHYLKYRQIPAQGYSRHFKLLKELSFPKPPLEEQRRIAALLDQADELRAKRRQSIVLLEDLAQSLFLDMFGDDKVFVSSCRLGEIADIASGITKGRKVPKGTSLKPVPYLAVANVQDKRLDLSNVKTIDASSNEIERYRLQKNDLLLTEGGDPDKLGRGTLWNEELPEAIHQNHIFRVRLTDCERVRPVYVNWYIASHFGKRYFLRSAKQTTGIASINATQLKNFPLRLPSIQLQYSFESKVARVRDALDLQTTNLLALDDLFLSLQAKAFRGEL